MRDARKVEHREEYRTISFLMKLPSRCLRERARISLPISAVEKRTRKFRRYSVVIFSSVSSVFSFPSYYRAAGYCFVKTPMWNNKSWLKLCIFRVFKC